MPMSKDEVCQHIKEAELDAIQYNGVFGAESVQNYEYYLGEPFGNEEEDESTVVSTDVADVVDADMASLTRVFLGSGDVVTFQPNNESKEEVEEAEEKNEYINWLIREQAHSFATLHGWMKDSEIKLGVVKYFVEDTETTKEIPFRGLSTLEVEAHMQDCASLRMLRV